LYRTLQGVKSSLEAGAIDITGLENSAVKRLEEAGWKPDYIVVARQKDLLTPTRDDLLNKEPLVILGAAKIGTTRLIDNVEVFGKPA
jgi:pantoate--beta-alanine ligase